MALHRVLTAAGLAAALGLFVPVSTQAQQVSTGGEDGGLRAPTPEEVQALLTGMGDSLSQSDAGLVSETRADGTTVLDLGGRYESVSLAKASGDEVEVGCATSTAEAKVFFGPAPQAPAQAEER